MTKIDSITHKKIVLIKQFYQRAIMQSTATHSAVDRILTVIGFDLAIETALKTVVNFLDSKKKSESHFQGLIDQTEHLLKKKGLKPLPDKANIQHIHALRNDAQHKAKYPSETDINDCRTYTRDFLNKLLIDVFEIDFNTITLADLVEHQTVKMHLTNSEILLSQKKYKEAAQFATAGLTLALSYTKSSIVGPLASGNANFVVTDGLDRVSKWNGRHLSRAFGRMQESILYVVLGMNYADYMKYKQIVGYAIHVNNDKPTFTGNWGNIDSDKAEFVVAFCSDSAIQIEQVVGNIEKPFGQERW